MSDTHPRYSISVAAELTGLHPQTLRMYEARGLVTPRRTPGGTRRYSEADLEQLRAIGRLRSELGLSLTGAEHVLALEQQVAALNRMVRDLQAKLLEAAADRRRALDSVHRSYRRDLVPYVPAKTPTRRTDSWTFRN